MFDSISQTNTSLTGLEAMDENEKKDDGIDINMPGFQGSVDKNVLMAIVHYMGPHLWVIVYTTGWGIAAITLGYAVSLVWN